MRYEVWEQPRGEHRFEVRRGGALVCRGATNGKAPSPGCGHEAHAPYACTNRDEDGVPCDCAGNATDDN